MNVLLKSLVPQLDFGWNRVRAHCGHGACHNKLLMRSVPQNRGGIRVGSQWYCGPDCFSAAMRAPLAALMSNRLTEMPRNPRISLGLAMLSRGFLTEDQLRHATSQSQRRGRDLEHTLLQMDLATEKQLAAARSVQWGYPVLAQEGPCPMVRADLPLTFLRSFQAAPLHYLPGKRLVLGFVQRVDPSVLQAIEQITGCRAEPCFLSPTEFEDQAERNVTAEDYEEAVIEQPGTPAHMAKTLGGVALEIGAREAIHVACKSWIWVRLGGKRKTVDVLFALRGAQAQHANAFSPEVTVGTPAWNTPA
jgi:hypothetical protein